MNKIFSSKLILPFSAAAIILVVGGVFAWSQINQTPEPQPTSSNTPAPPAILDTSDWVRYRSDELGISFEYPHAFHKNDACRIQEFNGGKQLRFALWQVETKDLGDQEFELFLEQFIEDRRKEGYITSIIREERGWANGHSALIVDHYTDIRFSGGGSPDKRGKFALIENRDNALLFISFINGVTNCGAPTPEDPFDHLISTIQFLR